ncbi:uncharacterized protein LOC110895549 [Helianthus annuus]|uniref:uncharacterized protein LOC110895549 n=1 Tax=Helianthus annuus TaxID=4232 RepID=UPI000B904974|nr:uncharacterized protein LOC110895549 [Helianthus annuus]
MNKVRQNYISNQNGILWDWKWSRLPNCTEEKNEWEELRTLLLKQSLSDNEDIWRWKENKERGFAVREVRKELYGTIDINTVPGDFEWSRIAIAKVNLFFWRAVEGKIPTLTALRRRGLQLGSDLCMVCGLEPESADHIIIQCPVAKEVWLQIWVWTKVLFRDQQESMKARFQEKNDWPERKVKIIYAIHLLMAWYLWRNRINKVFNNKLTNPNKILEEIKEESFDWMRTRAKIMELTWNEWKNFTFTE